MNEANAENILNCELIDLGLDKEIYDSLVEHTRCMLVRDLWGLSAKETCRQLGLNKDQLNRLLSAMEGIQPEYMRRHIDHCRWMMEVLKIQ